MFCIIFYKIMDMFIENIIFLNYTFLLSNFLSQIHTVLNSILPKIIEIKSNYPNYILTHFRLMCYLIIMILFLLFILIYVIQVLNTYSNLSMKILSEKTLHILLRLMFRIIHIIIQTQILDYSNFIITKFRILSIM